jgi:hypothetical protein
MNNPPQDILAAFMTAIVVRSYGLSGHFVVKQSQQISRRDVSPTAPWRQR